VVALDPLFELGQRALMRAYARAGRRGEALRQYKSWTETLKRELGVAPDAETQALAHEMTRSGIVAEADPRSAAEGRGFGPAGFGPGGSGAARSVRPAVTASGSARLTWPCLLSSIGVAVAPLRNLTGDPEQQYLVEAFTDDLVTDLLRHGRGLSLKPIADERGILGNPPGEAERGVEYLITGSAQRSSPGMLRVDMRITDAATAEYLWAGRHEFRPEDLAPIQTKITRRISRELHVLLLQEASRRAAVTADAELGINECLARAKATLKGELRAELSAQAQQWFLAVLARDPRNVEALVGLARTCQYLVSNPWWGDPRAAAASDLGREAVAIALALAPGHALAKCTQGMLCSAADSWRRPLTPSSECWRWIIASGSPTALPATMPPSWVAPVRRWRRSSAPCAWITPIAGTASGSSSAALPSSCSGASTRPAFCLKNRSNEIPATAAHNFS
jgi:TolB-like protein